MSKFECLEDRFNYLIGKQFKYKGLFGWCGWIGTIKAITPLTEIRTGIFRFWVKSEKGIVYYSDEIEILD